MARPDPRVIEGYLNDVEDELRAVDRLLDPPPLRFAAYHAQQAAEKLIKAVRLHRGIPATTDHNLASLIHDLSAADEWRGRLSELVDLSAYATAYRYPTTTGRRPEGPSVDELRGFAAKIRQLLVDARAKLLESSK
jgi:HEPN domain-containing protein